MKEKDGEGCLVFYLIWLKVKRLVVMVGSPPEEWVPLIEEHPSCFDVEWSVTANKVIGRGVCMVAVKAYGLRVVGEGLKTSLFCLLM